MIINEQVLTIDEFLTLLPWPKDVSGPKWDRLWHFDLNVQAEQIWPYIINANRLNKDLGYEGIEYTEIEGILHGKCGEGPRLQMWIELPWEWNYARSLSRLRIYSIGLLQYNKTAIYIQKINHNTGIRLYLYIGSISTHPLAEKIMNAFYDKFEVRYREAFARYEQKILQGGVTSTHLQQLNKKQQKKLDNYVDLFKQKGLDTKIITKLMHYILTEDEIELYHIRILPLAKKWRIDPDELLEVCLHAVKLGVLQITWDTICPHCRGPRDENPYLSEIKLKGHCDVCQIDFENNGKNSVEVVFHVHPSIREIKKIYYCSAEPFAKQHIKLQRLLLKENDETVIETTVPEGKYHYRVVGSEDIKPYVITADTQTVQKPNGIYNQWLLKLKNPSKEDKLFVLENITWDTDAILKPERLFSNEVFRELFSDEYLPYDLNLEIGLQTIMFIDIMRSTEYYEVHGDATAFNAIRKIFLYLANVARIHHGTIFKTMGDGCLLAFSQPLQAIESARFLQQQVQKGVLETDLNFRTSINLGRCLAVNFSNKIDFFGQTVNHAAKLQAGSSPGNIIISENLINDSQVKPFLQKNKIRLEKISVKHESIKNPIPAFKLIFC